MSTDISQSILRYLTGDKNIDRCVSAVALRYPGDSQALASYASGLRSLFPKYLARTGPVIGDRVVGRAYIAHANDACVSKLCRVLRERQPPPPPAPTPIIRPPDDDISQMLGYSMLHLYPLNRQTLENSRVDSVRTPPN